jgi:hypothetical protein
MNLPDKPIRDGLSSAIEGLIHEGKTVDVAESFSSSNSGWPRILIENVNTTEEGGKTCFLYRTSLTVTVSDRRINVGNSNDIEAIAAQIMQILIPESKQDNYFDVEGFSIWGIDLQGTAVITFEDGKYKYTEKTLNLLIKTEQL